MIVRYLASGRKIMQARHLQVGPVLLGQCDGSAISAIRPAGAFRFRIQPALTDLLPPEPLEAGHHGGSCWTNFAFQGRK